MKQGTWILRVEGKPMPKPRMTQRDKWLPSKAAQRYFAWAELVGLMGRRLMLAPIGRPVVIGVDFHMPMPKSWTRKHQATMFGQVHTNKPDIKNLIAGVEDALNKIAWRDDSLIVGYEQSRKFWTDGPGMTVIHIWTTDEQGELIHKLPTGYPQKELIRDGTSAENLT